MQKTNKIDDYCTAFSIFTSPLILNLSPSPHSRLSISTPQSPQRFKNASQARPTRRRVSWTKTGCTTCKRRRKKCDEAKPWCSTCLRLGLTCDGYDAFKQVHPNLSPKRDAAQTRNQRQASSPIFFATQSPQEVTDSKLFELSSPNSIWEQNERSYETSSTSRESEVEYEHGDSFESNDVKSMFQNPGMEIVTSKVVPNPTFTLGMPLSLDILGASSMEFYLLQYHVEHLSVILVNVDMPNNPLRSLLVPRALSSQMLLHSICAVSACHMANHVFLPNPQIRTAAISYYVKALNDLNRALSLLISNGGTLSSVGAPPADILLLTAAFLCKYEIVKGSVTKWRRHLVGVEHLMKTKCGSRKVEFETEDFINSFITYHRNVADITNPSEQIFSEQLSVYARPLGHSVHHDYSSLDPYMGFSKDLVKLMARISRVSRLESHLGTTYEVILAEVYQINETLEPWPIMWSSKKHLVPRGLSESTLQCLKDVASAFRHASYIYLHSILDRVAGPNNRSLSEVQKAVIRAQLICTMNDSISCCLAKVNAVPVGDVCEAALVPLLFLVGCETRDPEEFASVLSRFLSLEQSQGLGNISRAREVMQKVWASRNEPGGVQNWQDILEELGWDLILS